MNKADKTLLDAWLNDLSLLYLGIMAMYESYSTSNLPVALKDILNKSFIGKKNLWELVCGVNYFFNHFQVPTGIHSLETLTDTFKELGAAKNRSLLIAYKINIKP